jgi:hypothetical protein
MTPQKARRKIFYFDFYAFLVLEIGNPKESLKL